MVFAQIRARPYHWPHDGALRSSNAALVVIDMQASLSHTPSNQPCMSAPISPRQLRDCAGHGRSATSVPQMVMSTKWAWTWLLCARRSLPYSTSLTFHVAQAARRELTSLTLGQARHKINLSTLQGAVGRGKTAWHAGGPHQRGPPRRPNLSQLAQEGPIEAPRSDYGP